MSERFIVILAGGKGERFWPQSRLRRPKQLLPIVGEKPMLLQTYERVAPLVPRRNVYILTNVEQAAAVRRVCRELPRENVIAEPIGRDSGPAVGLATEVIAARNPKAVFASVHADAAIHDVKSFQRDLRAALAAAAASPVFVTLGVRPTEPSSDYGYIQRAGHWKTVNGREIFRALRFVEKPAPETAQQYVASGDYFWNTGMFVWSVRVVREAFARNAPELHAGLARIGAALAAGRGLTRTLAAVYPTLPRIAVDYALLEKADNVVVMPASFDWDDVGGWAAIARHFAPDSAGNVIRGAGVVEQGSGNIIVSEGGHLTAVLGTEDLVVVHTADATLVCPRGKAAQLKQLLKRLAEDPANRRFL
ncbi:MAG TPA: sugar phosphate nucleotidyltransferase [Lacunisphaera sp.]|nr:sugar phosphate nucleotidyltransferase [Lacunisphaera sp.]